MGMAADVRGKGHELKTTQKLPASPQVNVFHATVTADPLHCQDQTAHILRAASVIPGPPVPWPSSARPSSVWSRWGRPEGPPHST